MQESWKVTRDEDRLPSCAGAADKALDPRLFIGEWRNAKISCDGIVRVVFAEHQGSLLMRVFAADDPQPRDWGERPVHLLADRVDSAEGTKFRANYEFEFMQVRMHGWVKLGVLVIAVFNRFTDDSGRSDYFDREFLYAVDRA